MTLADLIASIKKIDPGKIPFYIFSFIGGVGALVWLLSIGWMLTALVGCGYGASFGWGPVTTMFYNSWPFSLSVLGASFVTTLGSIGLADILE